MADRSVNSCRWRPRACPVPRDALLDAAFEALLDEGPPLSAARVAARAGLSKALVFHHFGSQEGLLDAMAERVLSETQAGLTRLADDFPNPRERLVELGRSLLHEPAESPREAARLLRFWLEGGRGRLRDDLLADFVAATVREGVAVGSVRAGVDAGAIASLVLARWHGASVLHATGRAVDWDAASERLASELEAALR